MIDLNLVSNFVENNVEYLKYTLLVLFILWLVICLSRKKKKKVKLFYNTGFKLLFSAWDIIKFKIRFADYDDTLGIRYSYLISFKIFCWEFYRVKYTDQKGKIYKRKLRFGGIK